jgi:hypothetical protein
MKLVNRGKHNISIRLLALVLILLSSNGFSQTDMKKELLVKQLKVPESATITEIGAMLEKDTELQAIALVNWDAFSYAPDVKFRIAHSNNQIWLKFYVTENHILAQHTETNSATHRDSCVEFFVDPEQTGSYYNFEFNCIGTVHLAYGAGRNERTFITPTIIDNEIQIVSTLGNEALDEKGEEQQWEMTVVIPKSVFIHNKGLQLNQLTANANFYKCGDDTTQPHYLTWSPVGTGRPDFHQPDYFGVLRFE